ncbi:MAG: hypothetical protein ACWA5R_14310 [bacterium]
MNKQGYVFFCLVFALCFSPVYAVTYTVDSNNDFIDKNIGDGVCADILNKCTLRAAIQEANQTAAIDNINFNIPGPALFYVIDILGTPLPPITQSVNINADTQPGYVGIPIVQIKDGPAGQPGLVANAVLQLKGVSITGMDGDALQLNADGNFIAQNYFGLDPLENPGPNQGHGIHITSSGSLIGGGVGNGNVIAANTGSGISIESPASGNSILNNFIGVAADGSTAHGNAADGVSIVNSDNNLIGGTLFGVDYPNLISANGASGVKISGASSFDNRVLYNLIGSTGDGTEALGNSQWGVVIENGAHDNQVGDGSGTGNQVVDNGFAGIQITGSTSTNNSIANNNVGLNVFGNAALGSQPQGVSVNSADAVDIIENTISGNGEGLLLFRASHVNVYSNRIGTNKNGTAAVANSGNGITVYGGCDMVNIGSASESNRNVISGNEWHGIEVGSTVTPTANTNINIIGNTVGLGTDNLQSIPNHHNGINLVSGAENAFIGTDLVAGSPAKNVISANLGYGINIETNLVNVWTNIVGLDLNQTVARGNLLGGVNVVGNQNSLSGTPLVVAGNAGDGIILTGNSNLIGDFFTSSEIGTDESGEGSFGNAGSGCVVNGSDNFINVVSRFNGINGITLLGGTNNNWSRSSFGNNHLLGVDIANDGPDVNDPGDVDEGINRRINAPEIIFTDYDLLANQITVTYRISSDPANQVFPLNVRVCLTDDDFEECRLPFNGFTSTYELADVGLDKTIVVDLPSTIILPLSRPVVGLVTDADGNSSEVSAPMFFDSFIFQDSFESSITP